MSPKEQLQLIREGWAEWCEFCDAGRIYPDPQSALWEACDWCGGEGVVPVEPDEEDEFKEQQDTERRAA